MSVKISQLPSASAVTSDDLIPIVDSGSLTTQRATAQQLLDYVTGSTFNTLSVASLTASVSGTFTGNGSGLTNLSASQINNFTNDVRAQFTAGNGINIVTGTIEVTGSFETITSGNITGSGDILNPVTLKNNITLNSVSASQITASGFLGNNYTVLSGNVVFEGNSSASFGDYAYIDFNQSMDKMVVFPGLYVSGTITASSNITAVSASFNTVSASTYLGLPTSSVELTKLIVSSSVSLLTTQRAVFANNSISSSISITLPSASLADSREYYIIKSDSVSGSVNILPSSPNLINAGSSIQLNGPFQSVTLIHDGTDWYVF